MYWLWQSIESESYTSNTWISFSIAQSIQCHSAVVATIHHLFINRHEIISRNTRNYPFLRPMFSRELDYPQAGPTSIVAWQDLTQPGQEHANEVSSTQRSLESWVKIVNWIKYVGYLNHVTFDFAGTGSNLWHTCACAYSFAQLASTNCSLAVICSFICSGMCLFFLPSFLSFCLASFLAFLHALFLWFGICLGISCTVLFDFVTCARTLLWCLSQTTAQMHFRFSKFPLFIELTFISRPNLLAVNGARHAYWDSHAATFCPFQFLPNLASECWCIWSLESSMQPGLIIIDNLARLGKEHQCRSLDHFSLRWLDWSVANEISQDAYWADARVDDSFFGFHTEGKLRNIYCNSTTIPLVTTNAFQACWRKASWMSTTRLISLFLNSKW